MLNHWPGFFLMSLILAILYGQVHPLTKEKIENPKFIKDEYSSTHQRDGESILVPISLTHAGDELNFKFFSHNRDHDLQLRRNKAVDFSKLPIRLLGADSTEERKLKESLKDVELMSDTKHLASFAFNKKTKQFMHGGFQIGEKDFRLSANRLNLSEAHLTRQSKHKPSNLDDAKLRAKRKSKETSNINKVLIRRERDIEITPINANIELVLISDYGLYSEFQSGAYTSQYSDDPSLSLTYYIAHLVTMMDAHYATMMNNGIQISIELSGLIILKNNQSLSVLTEDKRINGSDKIDFDRVLSDFSDWLTTEEADNLLQKHDHTMILTGYDLYDLEDQSSNTIGLAWTGKICSRNESNSIVEIRAGLLSTDASTAAHELGHNLGAPHDDESCGPDNNYVMTALTGVTTDLRNRFLFSCCSQRSFYAIMKTQTCFLTDNSTFDNSTIKQHTAQYLPGEVFDANDQCYIKYGTSACGKWVYTQTNTWFCEDLWCIHPTNNSFCKHEYTAPADGTNCSSTAEDELWCIHGKCQNKTSSNPQLSSMTCDVSQCVASEFTCSNGLNVHREHMLHCIPGDWLCDGEEDCSDGSDETGTCDESKTCLPTEWRCRFKVIINGVDRTCVDKSKVCDGTMDCDFDGGSDEENCENVGDGKCYRCKDSSMCVTSTSECMASCSQDTNCEQGVRDLNAAPQYRIYYPLLLASISVRMLLSISTLI